MMFANDGYVVENVLRGHPDKICDQISDSLLDCFLELDRNSHIAVECLGVGNTLIVGGEVLSNEKVDVNNECLRVYKEITDSDDLSVINKISVQSRQLANAVVSGAAGDQGIMYGYACKGKDTNYLPKGYWVASEIAKKLDCLRDSTKLFLSDGKIQVYVEGEKTRKISVNVQYDKNADLEHINNEINKILIPYQADELSVNEIEGFFYGGFQNDTGLTGRKIMIDTYGGLMPHGGGAFSGKDPSKVDRSATYMCRFVAKNLVANNLANECMVAVAYEFGKRNPVMLKVYTDGEYSKLLSRLVRSKFDFCPGAIIERLNLKNAKYRPTATYGHFTNPSYNWEQIESM